MKNKILKILLIISLFFSSIFLNINTNISAADAVKEDTGFIWTSSKNIEDWFNKEMERRMDELQKQLDDRIITDSEYSIKMLELQEEKEKFWTLKEAITLTAEELRNWDIIFQNIPYMIQYSTNFILKFIWSVSMLVIIYWAFMFAFWSLSSDKSKWRDAIIYWLIWFVVSSLAWVLLRVIIANLTNLASSAS